MKVCGVVKIALYLFGFLVYGLGGSSVAATEKDVKEPLSPKEEVAVAEMIRYTLKHHPVIKRQFSQIETARSFVSDANWQYYPTPSLTVEQGGGDTVSSLRLQQPLWTWGKLGAEKSRAQSELQGEYYALDAAQQTLSLEFVQAYGDLLAANLKQQAHQKNGEKHQMLLDQMRRRIDQGVSAQSERVLAAARLEQVWADQALASSAIQKSTVKLESFLGRELTQAERDLSANTDQAISAKLKTVIPDTLQQAMNTAVSSSPALKYKTVQVEMADHVIDRKKAELLPEIYLRAQSQKEENQSTDNKIYVGFTTSLGPGLSSLNKVGQARTRKEAAQAELEIAQREHQEQVGQDWKLAAILQKRITALESSLAASEKITESWERLFRYGRKSWLDVMNAAKEKNSIELRLADAQSAQWVLQWRLAIHTQGIAQALNQITHAEFFSSQQHQPSGDHSEYVSKAIDKVSKLLNWDQK